jgi:hypothetical protein
MEKRRDDIKEVSKDLKEKTERELERLRKELYRLRKLKEQKEEGKKQEQEQVEKEAQETGEELELESNVKVREKGASTSEASAQLSGTEQIESSLGEIDALLSEEIEKSDHKTYEGKATYIESKLHELEQEIVGETGLIEEELSPYEQLLEEYPWLDQPRYEYMYQVPNKTRNPNDFESWANEWSKVLFDYAKYAILHILYLRQLYTEKPFSKFENRKKAIKEIGNMLVKQDLARWLSKKKDKLRVYWKTLDLLADEIYEWAYEMGKVETIIPIYEIREAKEEFNNLPKEDIEKIFKKLSEGKKAEIIRTQETISIKIFIE